MTAQTEAMGGYCDRHGHTLDASDKFCLNCGTIKIERPCTYPASEAVRAAPVPAVTIDATLAERGARYGAFDEHARVTQNIKVACADSRNWANLSPDMREAIEMIAHKLGRILNGDPTYADSWHDIIGYAKLVENRLTCDAPEQG